MVDFSLSSMKTFLLYSNCVYTTFFISIILITTVQNAKYVNFCAINISVTCEHGSGYLLLS